MPKNGKRPTVRQQEAMKRAGLNPRDWLVSKNLANQLHLVKRGDESKKEVISA
jgi:hypothetical protein